MKLNEDYFEKILFAEFTKNPIFTAMLHQKLDYRIFKEKSFQITAEFYRKFFIEYGRLPSKTDLKLYLQNDILAMAVKESFDKIANSVNLDEVVLDDIIPEAEKFMRRKMAALSLKDVVDKYNNGHIEPEEVIKKFEWVSSLKLIQNLGFDLYDDLEQYIATSLDGTDKLSTGFLKVDEYTNGGIPADGKFLGIVSAPTNTGKSIFLGNLATNVIKQGKTVLIVSLEMSEMVYATRIYSALYDMNIADVPKQHDELRENVNNNQKGKMLIKEFPPGTLTVEELDGYIHDAEKAGYKFDLICVDYLTLMAAPGAENSNDAGKTIARKLRALSYFHKCPVFTAAQINREGFGLAPDMKYMAESIGMCAEADFIISLYRNTEDVELNIMRAWILKSRLGLKDVGMRFYFNLKSLRFEDMNDDIPDAIATGNSGTESINAATSTLSTSILEALNN